MRKELKWLAFFDALFGSLNFWIAYYLYSPNEPLIFTILLVAFGAINWFLAIRLLTSPGIGLRRFHLFAAILQMPLTFYGLLSGPWVIRYLTRPHVKSAFGYDIPAEKLISSRGKLVIPLAIVTSIVAFLGLAGTPDILGLSFPHNILLAVRRAGQHQTMQDMRSLGTAIESYEVDRKEYPHGKVRISGMEKFLVPKYIKNLPRKDYWENEYEYVSDSPYQSYTIISYGKDHVRDQNPAYRGPTQHFENDIIFSTGSFVTYSEGT